MTTSRIDRVQSAMKKATACSTCKHQGGCKYQSMMNSWRYIDQTCNLWERWNASDAT